MIAADHHTSQVVLGFVGDVNVPRDFTTAQAIRVVSAGERIVTAISGIDVFCANLEGPLYIGPVHREHRSVILANHDEIGRLRGENRQTLFCLANNHIMDFGEEGLSATLRKLDVWGAKHFGAGRNWAEAVRCQRVVVHGMSIGFLGLTTSETAVGSIIALPNRPGCAGFDDSEKALDLVRSASRTNRVLCVHLHWGMEFYRYPTDQQVCFARRLVDAGAKIVIGHHAHVLQSVERYGNGLIAYGLGNFIFPQVYSVTGRAMIDKPGARRFAVLVCRIDGNGEVDGEFLFGRRGRRGELSLDRGPRARSELQRSSAPPQSLDIRSYRTFWRLYRARRRRGLSIAIVGETALKLFANRPMTILRTVGREDWRRLIRRLMKLLAG